MDGSRRGTVRRTRGRGRGGSRQTRHRRGRVSITSIDFNDQKIREQLRTSSTFGEMVVKTSEFAQIVRTNEDLNRIASQNPYIKNVLTQEITKIKNMLAEWSLILKHVKNYTEMIYRSPLPLGWTADIDVTSEYPDIIQEIDPIKGTLIIRPFAAFLKQTPINLDVIKTIPPMIEYNVLEVDQPLPTPLEGAELFTPPQVMEIEMNWEASQEEEQGVILLPTPIQGSRDVFHLIPETTMSQEDILYLLNQ